MRGPQRHLRDKASLIGEAFNPHAFSQQTGRLLEGPHSVAPRPWLSIRFTCYNPLEKEGESNSLQKVQLLFIFQQGTLWVRVVLGAPVLSFSPPEKSTKHGIKRLSGVLG